MDWTLEVVILPVSDIDRSIAFYRDQVGFHLDHDTRNEQMHVVQLTPTRLGLLDRVRRPAVPARDGAGLDARACSWSSPTPSAARQELLDRGVECSELMVFSPDDGGTFFGFADPDGNTWAVQELKVRGEKPLIPLDHRGRFGEGPEG